MGEFCVAVLSRAGHTPPLRRKPSPCGGRWRACAPDEGQMSGSRKFPLHQSPAVTASPTGGSLCKLLLSAAQFAGNRGRLGLLFTAQFAASVLLSAAQFLGCYSRHSLVLRRGGCYSRHNSKPLLFTAQFRFLRKKSGCYRRHNCVWSCYSRHNSAGLLNAAQLPPSAA